MVKFPNPIWRIILDYKARFEHEDRFKIVCEELRSVTQHLRDPPNDHKFGFKSRKETEGIEVWDEWCYKRLGVALSSSNDAAAKPWMFGIVGHRDTGPCGPCNPICDCNENRLLCDDIINGKPVYLWKANGLLGAIAF